MQGTRNADQTAGAPALWWIRPVPLVLGAILLTGGLALAIPEQTYVQNWGVRKFMDLGTVGVLALGLVALLAIPVAAGVVRPLAVPARWPDLPPAAMKGIRTAIVIFFCLTVAGYAAWLVSGFLNGFRPGDLLSLGSDPGTSLEIKETFAPIAGVTTLTQFGPPVVALALVLGLRERWVRALFVATLCLGLFRAVVLSERLAFLELLAPIALILAMRVAPQLPRGSPRRIRWSLVPALAVIAVVVGFSLAEATRSYPYRDDPDQTVFGYGLDRLAGYYATAFGNAEIVHEHSDQAASGVPYNTFNFIWEAPGADQLGLYEELTGVDPERDLKTTLHWYGNGEFNSPGGLLAVQRELGLILGTLALFACGALLAKVFRDFVTCHPYALVLYPSVVIGLLELPRIWYVGLGRLVPIFLAAGATAFLVKRSIRMGGVQEPEAAEDFDVDVPAPTFRGFERFRLGGSYVIIALLLAGTIGAVAVGTSVGGQESSPAAEEPKDPVEEVTALRETEPAPPDADGDDPAIWINPENPKWSTIIATLGVGGLAVYDLTGLRIQHLPGGEMNNVDLRDGFRLEGQRVSLAAATDMATDTIVIYAVVKEAGTLEDVSARPIRVGVDALGTCMYSDRRKKFYVFVTGEGGDGEVEQWELHESSGGAVDARLVRRFSVGSPSESCVVDDSRGDLYIAAENRGVWKYGAEPDAGNKRTLIDSTGKDGHLSSDVEGLAITGSADGHRYLIASSQASSSFVVYRAGPSNDYVTTFAIGGTKEIDAVQDTAGIAATGAFPRGLIVAQDDPDDFGTTNFKMAPFPDSLLRD